MKSRVIIARLVRYAQAVRIQNTTTRASLQLSARPACPARARSDLLGRDPRPADVAAPSAQGARGSTGKMHAHGYLWVPCRIGICIAYSKASVMSTPVPSRSRSWAMRPQKSYSDMRSNVLSTFVATALISAACARLARRDSAPGFDWPSINASKTLSWTPCYDTLKCARLTVPLQYSNTSAGEAQIAVAVSPSNFSVGDANYLGPILFNPGGPGDSGVEYLLEYETYFREIIGAQYDLVGFDPRGVGDTTPYLSVFASAVEAIEFFSSYPYNADAGVSSVGQIYAQSQILGELATLRAQTVAESVSTPAVATDMLQIARAFGYEEVNYWGVSYGSVLGATFAAMFPQNVGRVIIDGVFDSYQWYYGAHDNSSLLDTTAALTSVYDACVAAGPSNCALWENTTSAVAARVSRILTQLHAAPLTIFNATSPTNVTFATVDYTAAHEAFFQTVYFPYGNGPAFADAFVGLENGNASLLYEALGIPAVDPTDLCATPERPLVIGSVDVMAPILCGDALVDRRGTFERAQADYAIVRNLSEFGGDWWPVTTGPCSTWPLKAKDQFNGSFETNTSKPILFISNTLDPVTPIQSGRKMSKGFSNSVLLTQNSTGHSSLSGFSACAAQAIGAFFANGTLPTEDTICQPDTQPFAPTNDTASAGAIGRRDLRAADFSAAKRALEGAKWFQKRLLARRV
ncbi:alpha/beta hydrolase [Phanerochaete sordida]|uniref:Alpha/beta hydrolase n=1 Tax=Phanerochaete sordida TaxID=48140 RepID=A0A9P3GJ92_9APHY|nr:alpha/beta hydrolase [Phanerochaete sordida]